MADPGAPTNQQWYVSRTKATQCLNCQLCFVGESPHHRKTQANGAKGILVNVSRLISKLVNFNEHFTKADAKSLIVALEIFFARCREGNESVRASYTALASNIIVGLAEAALAITEEAKCWGGDSRRTSGNRKAGLIVKESRGSLPQILDGLVGRSPGDSHEKPPGND